MLFGCLTEGILSSLIFYAISLRVMTFNAIRVHNNSSLVLDVDEGNSRSSPLIFPSKLIHSVSLFHCHVQGSELCNNSNL